jgi:hypothetical protein
MSENPIFTFHDWSDRAPSIECLVGIQLEKGLKILTILGMGNDCDTNILTAKRKAFGEL